MGFTDLVIPKNNESEFAEMAGRLGLDGVCFLYEKRDFKDSAKRINELNQKNLSVSALMLTDRKTKEFAVSLGKVDIRKLRKMIAAEFESAKRWDSMHFRASGLNHVICRSAKKNSVIIGFSFSSIINAPLPRRAVLLGRMQQNIRLCRKFDVKTVIATFARTPWEMRRANDLRGFFTSLGMSPKDSKNSLACLHEILSDISNPKILRFGRITVSRT